MEEWGRAPERKRKTGAEKAEGQQTPRWRGEQKVLRSNGKSRRGKSKWRRKASLESGGLHCQGEAREGLQPVRIEEGLRPGGWLCGCWQCPHCLRSCVTNCCHWREPGWVSSSTRRCWSLPLWRLVCSRAKILTSVTFV